jgi:hypothetical protein
MDDFEDRELDRTHLEEPAARSAAWIPLVLLVLLAGGALWYFYFRNPPADSAVQVRTDTARPDSPDAGRARGDAEPGEDIALPPLEESDSLVRDLVSRLSSHPQVAAWLTTDHLVRNFTVTVVNIADGRSPAVHLKAVAPQGGFTTQGSTSDPYIDPATYARYNTHADAVAGIDARGAARLYATLRPRIDEAYAELGAPDKDFDRTLERAIVELLETPIVESPIQLEGDSVAYTFADARLESLSAAQRQFLRMGPRNMRLVKAKLREIAGHVGIPEGSLPAPDGNR